MGGRADKVRQHLANSHNFGVNWFNSDHCDYRTKQKRNLQNYLANVHEIGVEKLPKIQDTDLFLLLEEMNIIDPNVRKCLDRQLQMRNSCAHPNPYVIKQRMVDAYIEELALNILLK